MLIKQGHYGLARRMAHLTLYVKNWIRLVPGPIKSVGVTFSHLFFNIWDLNSQEILLKIKKKC